MASKKKFFSIVIALVMLFSLMLSALFVVKEAEHPCCGEDCGICQQLQLCIQALNNITPKPHTAEVVLPAVFAVVLALGFLCEGKNKLTLIDLKVKLSD